MWLLQSKEGYFLHFCNGAFEWRGLGSVGVTLVTFTDFVGVDAYVKVMKWKSCSAVFLPVMPIEDCT